MLEKIALIDPKDWELGPEHVNAIIAGIEVEFDVENQESEINYAKAITTQDKKLIANRMKMNSTALEFSIHSALFQIREFQERIRGINSLDATYKEGLMDHLDKLSNQLSKLLSDLPQENEDISDEKTKKYVGWWREFSHLFTDKSKAYISPDNVSEAAVPMGIIFGCAGISGMIMGPIGFGAGAYFGGLITGQVKPSKAAEKIIQNSEAASDDANNI